MYMTIEEAARILDPETSREALAAFCGSDPDYRLAVCVEICRIAAAVLRERVAQNEPLTLDELREMEGEPVWIEPWKEWMLVDCFTDEYLEECFCLTHCIGGHEVYPTKEYGERIKAYRRKPEVQNDEILKAQEFHLLTDRLAENPPLTIKDIWRMDGEPVWIQFAHEHPGEKSHWALVDVQEKYTQFLCKNGKTELYSVLMCCPYVTFHIRKPEVV